jgi:predicted NBD/HSP70 family sugar kinase
VLDIPTEETGKSVLAIDIGGDKLIAARYDLHDGRLERKFDIVVRRDEGGSRYVGMLTKLADLAHRARLPVGISFAGPTDGTRLVAAPNLPALFQDLHDRYSGDFANLFPSVTVTNDAEAGIMAASVEAIKHHPTMRHVIYIINGSGLGGAVLSDGTIYACEPGHIEVDPQLNAFNQGKPCGMLGAAYVCIEVVAASKAGIEDLWFQRRSKPCSGREIANHYLLGDELAGDLYDNSALVTAHAIEGLAHAFQLCPDQTAVVGHGGIFNVPGYGKRVRSILEKDRAQPRCLLFTSDFSTNTCLDGAALAAIMSGSGDREPAGSGSGLRSTSSSTR